MNYNFIKEIGKYLTDKYDFNSIKTYYNSISLDERFYKKMNVSSIINILTEFSMEF
jgi:hypothetical protein